MNSMTPEELEKKWKELELRVNFLEETRNETIDSLKRNKLKSAQQQLASQYKKFSIISPMVGICVSFMQWGILSWQLLLGCAAFFITAGLMDGYLYHRIKNIDLNTEGVEIVAEKARLYKRRHHCFQIILIAAVIPIFIGLFMSYVNEYSRWGMIVGLIFGVGVGLSLYLKMMRNYRILIKSDTEK